METSTLIVNIFLITLLQVISAHGVFRRLTFYINYHYQLYTVYVCGQFSLDIELIIIQCSSVAPTNFINDFYHKSHPRAPGWCSRVRNSDRNIQLIIDLALIRFENPHVEL